MTKRMVSSYIHFSLLITVVISLQQAISLASKKTYIVYLGTHQHGPNPTELDAKLVTQSHFDYMGSILGSYEKARESVLYNYNKYINGFVAKLSQDEVDRVKASSNVVTVFENQRLNLSTTRSWEFLGLEQNTVTPNVSLWSISRYGNDVIIGNLDMGVWPESESFNDEGFGPIPSRWKGDCIIGSDPTFKCNKKLIGAKYFHVEESDHATQTINKSVNFLSPRDMVGHGTHTLSTAGGNFVKGVDVYGFGNGIAKGGSPNARVASYKICWPQNGCTEANLLAAFEAAIDDGVDVLSIQLNSHSNEYKSDAISIGSFHAIRHGITMVASAGNEGGFSPVTCAAPWIFTIGASTIDRDFYNEVYLGNTTSRIKGAYLGPNKLPKWQFYPLIDGASAAINSSTTDNAHFCLEGSLDPSKTKGKIVVCEEGRGNFPIYNSKVVQEVGGVGMIVTSPERMGDRIFADPHFLPSSHISFMDGQTVHEYINSTKNPTAYITDLKTLTGVKPAPVMANFSSRGPSTPYPYVLKPDITAPGVNIIAAYSEAVGPTSFYKNDTRRVKYYVLSGTSMSSPHVAGVVGLVKSIHPEWSPAAIRSAIMTTATILANDNKPIMDSNGQPATPFAYGAGHINPNAAADPGLIYNLTEIDYLEFLCSLGSYDEKDLKLFSPIPFKCTKSKSILDFNYPSITVTNFSAQSNLSRTVTNVGNPGTYEATVVAPSGINIRIVPSKINFNRTGEEQTYRVELKLTSERPKEPEYVFGSLTWSDGTHSVRSPLVVQKI